MTRPDTRFYGIRACLALASARPDAVHRAFFDVDRAALFADLSRSLARRRRPYRVVEEEELSRVAGTKHHEGVCLIADLPPIPDTGALVDAAVRADMPARWLFLDGVGNPHNVGAILRTAAHFGGGAVIGLDGELPPGGGALARVAEGGAEQVPLVPWQNPRSSFAHLADQGFVRIAAVVEGGESLHQAVLPRRCIFLMGAEREGLSEAARATADRAVRIPGTSAVQSLNVATACAIFLAEHARQHPHPSAS